jgi:hypothetical protein
MRGEATPLNARLGTYAQILSEEVGTENLKEGKTWDIVIKATGSLDRSTIR